MLESRFCLLLDVQAAAADKPFSAKSDDLYPGEADSNGICESIRKLAG